ncbi:hypothetical protein F66182_978 [Fusarium sp. NRRL 66182]|nr:hypothetical protein F66182_978 [Fusarium sp. NRRL 66182]
MRLYQILVSAAYLAIGVQAHLPFQHHARESSDLTVSLAPVSGKSTEVKATITNNGASDLSLLKIGTILDSRPVKKLILLNENGDKVPFMGIQLSLYYQGLQAKHYENLSAGSSISRTIDLSTMYDLKPGTYSVYAEGSFPSVSGESKKSTSISFKSRMVSIKVGKASSAEVQQKASKRTIVDEERCTPEQLKATTASVQNCEKLARAAAADASDVHSARFVEYFNSNETQAREHVTGRLLAVAEECSTTDSGNTRALCYDNDGYCEFDGPLVAYTIWVSGRVIFCPLFYDTQPPLPVKCHQQDQATTALHEMTHARAVFEQEVSTVDYAYGYENSTALDALSCLYNADSYALYANGEFAQLFSVLKKKKKKEQPGPMLITTSTKANEIEEMHAP